MISRTIYRARVIDCEIFHQLLSIADCMLRPDCRCAAYLRQVNIWEAVEEAEIKAAEIEEAEIEKKLLYGDPDASDAPKGIIHGGFLREGDPPK